MVPFLSHVISYLYLIFGNLKSVSSLFFFSRFRNFCFICFALFFLSFSFFLFFFCYWLLWLIFFFQIVRALGLIYSRIFQCWWVPCFLLFLSHTICHHRISCIKCCVSIFLFWGRRFWPIIIIIISILQGFFATALTDGFHWSLSDSKPPQSPRLF